MRAADASLLIVALVVGWSLYRAHRNPEYSFNLFDLVMDNGRLSRLACVFMGSFVVTSWVVIRVAFDGKMTETLFAAYGAMWVAPIIAKLFAGQSIPTPPTEKPASRQGEIG